MLDCSTQTLELGLMSPMHVFGVVGPILLSNVN
jgi:hypothetical protein